MQANCFPLGFWTKGVLIRPAPKQLHRDVNIYERLRQEALYTVKWLSIKDRAKVIMQVFTTIELYGGDMTSCCWIATGFRSRSSNNSFDRKREAVLMRRALMPIKFFSRCSMTAAHGDWDFIFKGIEVVSVF